MNEAPRYPQPVAAVPYLTLPPEHEVTLADLLRVLSAKRRLMAATAVAIVLLAVAYALLVTPLYRAEAFLLSPVAADVDVRTREGTSVRRMEIEGLNAAALTPTAVYDEFIKNLNSRQIRREFFDSRALLELYRRGVGGTNRSSHEAFEEFNDSLVVHLPQQSADQRFLRVTFDLYDAERASELVNDFVASVNQRSVGNMLSLVDDVRRTRMNVLRNLIERERNLAEALVADRITRLNENIAIASALGIVEPVQSNIAVMPGADVEAIMPAYMRGVKSLSAERAALEQRKNIDAFVIGLRARQNELAFLESIEIDPSNLRAAVIDQPAAVPEKRIKPRRSLIVLAGTIIGVLVGVCLAFLVNLAEKLRAELRADANAGQAG